MLLLLVDVNILIKLDPFQAVLKVTGHVLVSKKDIHHLQINFTGPKFKSLIKGGRQKILFLCEVQE